LKEPYLHISSFADGPKRVKEEHGELAYRRKSLTQPGEAGLPLPQANYVF